MKLIGVISLVKVFCVCYVLAGFQYSIMMGYYFYANLEEFNDKIVREKIKKVVYAGLEKDKLTICVSDYNNQIFSINVFMRDFVFSANKEGGSNGYIKVERNGILSECNKKGNEIKVILVSLTYGLNSNALKDANTLSADNKVTVYEVTVTEPDMSRVKKSKDIIVVFRESINNRLGFLVDFEGKIVKGDKSRVLYFPLAIVIDILTYPYQLYLLVKSGG
ncbi:hypothetical protein [Zooshikella harenae]|uniref:Uncharacterized protein n=1 Tax=Zooshikella harenae TaxID=2827238 RepID=A0ABS5ZK13_9GAMM|nr:hypothetical protein [Zooshikella harenae]MBU2714290.1 hypothetical protein [Zooshikella harenae]